MTPPILLTAPSTAVASGLALHVVAETITTITLGWTPPAGAAGYRFRRDGARWSHTWDGARSSVRFSKPFVLLEVEALGVLTAGRHP